MTAPTMTEALTLATMAGGRCQLRLIRSMLHGGRTLDLAVPDSESATGRGWARIVRIAPNIKGQPAVDGIRYILTTDGTAYRVGTDEAIWCRIAPETRKARKDEQS